MLHQKMRLHFNYGVVIIVCVNLFCMLLRIIYINILHIYLIYLSIGKVRFTLQTFTEVHCITSSQTCKPMNLQGLVKVSYKIQLIHKHIQLMGSYMLGHEKC